MPEETAVWGLGDPWRNSWRQVRMPTLREKAGEVPV